MDNIKKLKIKVKGNTPKEKYYTIYFLNGRRCIVKAKSKFDAIDISSFLTNNREIVKVRISTKDDFLVNKHQKGNIFYPM